MINLLKMLFVNIKNYGFFEIILIIIYESIYFLNPNYRKHIFYDDEKTDRYSDIDIKDKTSKMNGSYNPTPIYLLKLIENELKKIEIKDFTFVDFGCGAGRVIYFFRNFFKKKIGIDIDNKYKIFFKNEIFLIYDIRNIKKENNIKEIENDQKIILFFYRPIEDASIFKLIDIFKKKKILAVTINIQKNNSKNYKILYEKYFPDKNRNIIIYSNF